MHPRRLGRTLVQSGTSRFRRIVPIVALAAVAISTIGVSAASAATGQPAAPRTTISKTITHEPAVTSVGQGVKLKTASSGPAQPASQSIKVIHRSGNYYFSVCSANVSLTTHDQTCLLLWMGGTYGNEVRVAEGKFALYHSGRHYYKWTIEWMNSPSTWLAYSVSGNFGQPWWYIQSPQRYDTGGIAAYRYVMLGYRVWFILWQLEGNKYVNVCQAYAKIV